MKLPEDAYSPGWTQPVRKTKLCQKFLFNYIFQSDDYEKYMISSAVNYNILIKIAINVTKAK